MAAGARPEAAAGGENCIAGLGEWASKRSTPIVYVTALYVKESGVGGHAKECPNSQRALLRTAYKARSRAPAALDAPVGASSAKLLCAVFD